MISKSKSLKIDGKISKSNQTWIIKQPITLCDQILQSLVTLSSENTLLNIRVNNTDNRIFLIKNYLHLNEEYIEQLMIIYNRLKDLDINDIIVYTDDSLNRYLDHTTNLHI